jgi:hypothetical protein
MGYTTETLFCWLQKRMKKRDMEENIEDERRYDVE